ncbi:hypothetical protein [Rhodococcoides fascians]|uniref:hypothetical protein n=1 Tax=Rhodococcoides fascians TaxID=1828 RepID=UPI000561369F|nr:hypothetical protein [Rhodococcus fascians]
MNTHQIIVNHLETAIELHRNIDLGAHEHAITALALASAAEITVLIEEAEGVLGRIDHDWNCKYCRGKLDADAKPENFWCTN